MLVKCMLDNKQYQSKPQGGEIGNITNRLAKAQTEINIKDLANYLSRGCTFKPSLLKGTKETDWLSTNLFALDFDENTTIDEELNRCKELNILPVFGYTSFSHTEEHHKFRLVFAVESTMTNYKLSKDIQLTLMKVFKNCDEKCKNLSRLYFGGRQLIYEGYDNRMDYKYLLNEYGDTTHVEDKDPLINNIYESITIQYLSGGLLPTEEKEEEKVEEYYNIKAIRERNVEYLKNKLNLPKVMVTNGQELSDYLCSYDLGSLLEYKYPSSIKCLFHKDSKPSAGIFQSEDGHYLYKCFVCGFTYNIIHIVERIGKFQSRRKTLKFLRDIFNIEFIESDWQKEQKSIIEDNIDLIQSGELEDLCPTAYKNIRNNILYLLKLHSIAKNNVHNENLTDDNGLITFFASNKYLCNEIGLSENSSKEISKKNVLLQYHGLLNKLDDSKIPEKMLKRSQAIALNRGGKHEKHINVFSIPPYNVEKFAEVEMLGKQWQDNGYTMKACSREMFFRTEGLEVANTLYPQYKNVFDKESQTVVDRTTTNISNQRVDIIIKIIFDIINHKGYVLEKEIIEELACNGEVKTTKSESEKQVKKCIKEIMSIYNLQKIKSNKKLKEELGVVESGYPFLITKIQ